jgi:hypothetical protein
MFLVQITLLAIHQMVRRQPCFNEQQLGLSFSARSGLLGWTFSGRPIITIIGWAWVYVAQMRWFAGISGHGMKSSSSAPGWSFWRAIVCNRQHLRHPDSMMYR